MPGIEGTVYLACFEDAVGSGARHYLGWTSNLEERVKAHASGRGARLLALVVQLGVNWKIVRTWPGTRYDEKRMKRGGSLARYCPTCQVAYRRRRNEQQTARRARDGRADRPRSKPRGPLQGSS